MDVDSSKSLWEGVKTLNNKKKKTFKAKTSEHGTFIEISSTLTQYTIWYLRIGIMLPISGVRQGKNLTLPISHAWQFHSSVYLAFAEQREGYTGVSVKAIATGSSFHVWQAVILSRRVYLHHNTLSRFADTTIYFWMWALWLYRTSLQILEKEMAAWNLPELALGKSGSWPVEKRESKQWMGLKGAWKEKEGNSTEMRQLWGSNTFAQRRE
jgi:hypothetical protein